MFYSFFWNQTEKGNRFIIVVDWNQQSYKRFYLSLACRLHNWNNQQHSLPDLNISELRVHWKISKCKKINNNKKKWLNVAQNLYSQNYLSRQLSQLNGQGNALSPLRTTVTLIIINSFVYQMYLM